MQWNEPYREVDEYKIGTSTRIVNLDRKYTPGLGQIKVYYNGISAINGREYEELNSTTLLFTFDLQSGDTVEVEYLKFW